MKIKIFLGSTLLLFSVWSPFVDAQEEAVQEINDKYINGAYKTLGDELGKAENEYQSQKAEAAALQQQVSDLNKQLKAAESEDRGHAPWVLWGQTLTSNSYNEGNHKRATDLRAQVNAAQAQLNHSQDDLQTALAKANNATKAYNAVNATKNSEIAFLNQKVNGLGKELSADHLLLKFSKLENKLSRTQDTLNVIENKFDQALLGIYLQRKIGEVLNSKALCSAISSCSSGGGGKATANADTLKEIFSKVDNNNYSDPAKASSSGK